jgi:hypothetical protein
VCGARVGAGFEYDEQLRVESARLFGNMNKYAYYFTDLLVGSPSAQRASVIIDTGSRLVGFPCSDCDHCGQHLDPAYDASQSSSLRWQICSQDCPDSCQEDVGRCPYKETYAEGSAISGFWFEDMVELGDSFSKNPPVRATLGCHTNENKLFYTQRASGIMGLAPTMGASRQPTFLQSMFSDSAHVNSEVFSICLATWGGRLNIGGYNSSYHSRKDDAESIQWVTMHASHYYYISPSGMSLGKSGSVGVVSGSTDFGVTIVDSGTTFTYFPEAVYDALSDSISQYCSENDCGGSQDGAECFYLEGDEGPVMFPPIRMDFDASSILWRPESYLHQRTERSWCFSFQSGSVAQTVLGISFMIHKDFVFDLARGRLGVADADCPEYREQPEMEMKFNSGPAAPRLGASMREHVQLASSPERTTAAIASSTARPQLAVVGVVAALALVSLVAVRARWLRSAPIVPDDEARARLRPSAQGDTSTSQPAESA